MSIVFLFDENPDVASAGSGGAAVGGARSVPDHAASLELRASGAVGSRWQPVFGSSDCLGALPATVAAPRIIIARNA